MSVFMLVFRVSLQHSDDHLLHIYRANDTSTVLIDFKLLTEMLMNPWDSNEASTLKPHSASSKERTGDSGGVCLILPVLNKDAALLISSSIRSVSVWTGQQEVLSILLDCRLFESSEVRKQHLHQRDEVNHNPHLCLPPTLQKCLCSTYWIFQC